MKNFSRGAIALGTLALLGAANTARAVTPGLDFTGGSTFTSTVFPGASISSTLGWTFTVTAPTTVTSLGTWDEGSNGLIASKQVGIWSNSDPNTLLTQATVTNSSTPVASTSSAGRWLFETLASPLTLAPGVYTIGGLYLAGDIDPYRFNTSAPVMAPGTIYDGARYPTNGSASTSLKFPTGNGAIGYFGANFGLADPAAATPEPGSMALLVGMGVSGTGLLLRRRRVSQTGRGLSPYDK